MVFVKELNLDHLFQLTDYTGIIQHCKYCTPDFETGYTTDDNSRALIVTSALYDKTLDKRLIPLIKTYLSFLHYAQNNNGKWRNFMNFQRQFIEEGSEDSFGRSLWSLGFLHSLKNLPDGILNLSNYLITKALPNVKNLNAIRAKAYSIIGLSYLNSSQNKTIKKLIKTLADDLVKQYVLNKSNEWLWFEDIITYANGILPYSLIKAYQVIPDKTYLTTALETLDFLSGIVMQKGYLKLIGCNGWAVKGKKIAQFDEQPIDAADMVLAYSEAYKVTENIEYLEKAEKSFKWFLGLNCHGIPLVDPETGACFDGLTKDGINLNQGAESLFSYMISYLCMEDLGLIESYAEETKQEELPFDEAV